MKHTIETFVKIPPEKAHLQEEIIERCKADMLAQLAPKLPSDGGWLTLHYEIREPDPNDPFVWPRVNGTYAKYHRLTVYERSMK